MVARILPHLPHGRGSAEPRGLHQLRSDGVRLALGGLLPAEDSHAARELYGVAQLMREYPAKHVTVAAGQGEHRRVDADVPRKLHELRVWRTIVVGNEEEAVPLRVRPRRAHKGDEVRPDLLELTAVRRIAGQRALREFSAEIPCDGADAAGLDRRGVPQRARGGEGRREEGEPHSRWVARKTPARKSRTRWKADRPPR